MGEKFLYCQTVVYVYCVCVKTQTSQCGYFMCVAKVTGFMDQKFTPDKPFYLGGSWKSTEEIGKAEEQMRQQFLRFVMNDISMNTGNNVNLCINVLMYYSS